jgi:ketosteroid isomerase-like protein
VPGKPPHADTPTPRAVLDAMLALINSRDWAELAALYSRDAVLETPFAAAPDRVVAGLPAIRERLERATAVPVSLRPRNVVVHETQDPEVLIAEFDYDGTVLSTGAIFEGSTIRLLRVQEGHIVHMRAYQNHSAILDAAAGRPSGQT